MSGDELIKLFASVPPEVRIYSVAQTVLQKMLSAENVEVVFEPSERRPASHYREVYTQRLEHQLSGNRIPFGMLETVYKMKQAKGTIGGGYARFDSSLVYFFTNDLGQLIGCVGDWSE